MKKLLLPLAVVGAFSLFAGSAQAALFCSAGSATGGITESNMTYDLVPAADCYGLVQGNNNENTDIDALVGAEWGTGWSYLLQGDETGNTNAGMDTGSFADYDFTLTWDGESDGVWTLSAIGSPLPQTFDFIAAMKGGSQYGLWYFPQIVVDASETEGTWEVVWSMGASPNATDLSHLSLYIKDHMRIPEPGTLALFGIGLIGLAAVRRRRLSKLA